MFKRYKFKITLSCLTGLPQEGEKVVDVKGSLKRAFPSFSLVSVKQIKETLEHSYRKNFEVIATASRIPTEFNPLIDGIDKQFQSWEIRVIDGD